MLMKLINTVQKGLSWAMWVLPRLGQIRNEFPTMSPNAPIQWGNEKISIHLKEDWGRQHSSYS